MGPGPGERRNRYFVEFNFILPKMRGNKLDSASQYGERILEANIDQESSHGPEVETFNRREPEEDEPATICCFLATPIRLLHSQARTTPSTSHTSRSQESVHSSPCLLSAIGRGETRCICSIKVLTDEHGGIDRK